MRTIIYDVEVLRGPGEVEGGWDNPEGMGFGTAVAWDSGFGFYRFYSHKDPGDLFSLQARLSEADLIVGFNHMRFDSRVIYGNDFDYRAEYEEARHCDLLIEVVRAKFPGCHWVEEAQEKFGMKAVHNGSISLDGIAQGTLGLGKIGHGAHAPKFIQENKWAEVFQYNLHDVRLTKMLWEYWEQYGYLIDRDNNVIRKK